MNHRKILVVDDDKRLRDLLQRYLTEQGFTVRTAENAEAMDKAMARDTFELIVLDLMLPGEDGLSICRRLRASEPQQAIIMLTAKGDDIDRIIGLEMGADDYVPKPCTPRELLARIYAILRRTENSQNKTPNSDTLFVSNVKLIPSKRQATKDDRSLELTSTEFNLLEVLMRHAGQVVSKDTLSQEALDRKLAKFDRSIDVHISSIRQKLGDASLIQPVRGLGYLFVRN